MKEFKWRNPSEELPDTMPPYDDSAYIIFVRDDRFYFGRYLFDGGFFSYSNVVLDQVTPDMVSRWAYLNESSPSDSEGTER